MYRLAVLPALLLIADSAEAGQIAQTEADLVAVDTRPDIAPRHASSLHKSLPKCVR